MIKSISALKARFLAGMKPTQEDFANLIDSFKHRQDASDYRVVFNKEVVPITVESNTIQSLSDYAATDAIEVFKNGQLIDYSFTPPNQFTFADAVEVGQQLMIKKTSIVTA